jgi:hypothetical protein
MRPVETVLRKGGEGAKEKDGGDESKVHSIFCKCHSVPSGKL